ncbi:N-6 DNA methylase, partial [Patescibacteria group bacterium]|nr:N-6 DNA methylase [Patescibacteria group bacterium]
LNGGLFEQHTFDFYSGQPNYILKIPDDWLKDFLEILELYNFTIDENTSMDIELSIDPEMLGRIFENLLAEINPETGESARKSTGSYYTPRAIVDYMVQTSLREFLLGKFPPSSREYLDKNGFIKLCKLGNKELLKYIQQHFHKRLVHKSNYFSEDGFENLVVFPRIIAKLRGLDAFDRNKSMHRHFQVNLAVWRAFLSEEVSVVDKLYGNIKKLNLKKRHSWVSVCLIFKYKKKLFAAFFSPLLTNELSLSTIYSIDEKRYDKLKKVHQQLDLEEIFELQKKSSRRDADLPHTGTNPVAAQRFSTLRKLLSDSRLLDEELRVKLGSRDMVLQEVEEILAGTMEQETEDDTKRKIVEALDKLKVLDPACGSGAFPMGILQKVVQILQEVDTDNKLYLEKVIQSNPPELRPTVRASLQRQNLNYARKLGIIRKSIFGVDIQPIATEISRLRVFLSLIVDQKIDDKLPNRGIEVLPNLDFKFVTANSLIGLPKEESDAEQQKLLGMEEEKEIKELKNIMEEYFNSHNDERENCKNRFYEVRSKLFRHTINNSSWNEKTEYLSGWDPFGHESASWFDPEWMFGIKDGFDIVIANPPYSLKLANDYKGALRRIYKTIFFKLNLFACFIERGVHLTKEKGVLTYINPNLLFANDSLKKLRKYLIQNTTIHQLINLGDGVFENVTMPTMIFMLSKTIDFNNEITLYPLVEDMNALKENFTVKQTSVLENFNYVFETMNPQTKEIISRIEKKSLKLGEVLDINQGIITGDDETYLGEVKENTTWKPTIRGKDIDRYFTKPPKLFVKYQPDELACPRDEKIFNCRKKLLMRRTSDRPIVSYDNTQLYNLHTLYSCRGKDNNYGLFFLLALLNSKLFKFIYHQKLGTEIGRTFAEIKIVYTRQLPVIVCTPEKQKSIIDIVDKIFVITKLDDYLKNPEKQIQVKKYEKQIDQMIYKLYGLTKEEIKIVEERT